MKIAIIGTGNVGSALSKGWAKAGHDIFLGVRDQNNFKGKDLLSLNNCSVHSINDAIAFSEVVLMSVPPKVIPELAPTLENIADKILIDPTNSFPEPPKGFSNCFEAWHELTSCKNIVKAFNNTGYENMLSPSGVDTFVAGNSQMAKEIVKDLANDIGFSSCYDFGGDDKTGLLEQLAICWINLAYFQGMGSDFAMNIINK